MRCKGTGYLRPALVKPIRMGPIERLLDSRCRDGVALLRRWHDIGDRDRRSAHLYRSLGPPFKSLGQTTLCRVALPVAIQVRQDLT